MPAWKDRLSEQEIWETVAYILTLSKLTSDSVEPVEPSSPSVATPTPEPKEKTAPQPAPLQASLVGDPEQGKSLFFDSSNDLNCGNCHKVHGVGNDVGPDLSHEQQRPVKDLFRDIILPSAAVAPDRETLVITTKNGERIEGLKVAEDDSQIKVYDVGTLPPVLRTIPKSRIQKQQMEKRSGMPMKYAEIYTLKQLLDIIAYLKAGDIAAHSTVSLEDLF
jgi:putative heme-binding domain-containing protein